jgi:PAS domain-containing protein
MNNFSDSTGPSLPASSDSPKELERTVAMLEAALRKLESENRALDARNTDYLRRIEYYLRVINSMKDGYLVHRDGIIQDINEQITEITGYQAHELLGRNVRDFMPLNRTISSPVR